MATRLSTLAVALLAVGACQDRIDTSLQRMMNQERCTADAPSAHFRNGSCNQQPASGTVPFRALPASPIATGRDAEGRALRELPVPRSRALLAEGQGRFDLFCATCHGLLGDGQSEVAENMSLRTPPVLFEPRIRALADGRIFRVISEGYGLMPGYAHALSVEQRWAVVAYLRVLAASQAMPLAELSESAQEEARKWLR